MLSSTQSSSLRLGVSKGGEEDDSICHTTRWFQTCLAGFGCRSATKERLTPCHVLHVRVGMKSVDVWRSEKVKVGGKEFYIIARALSIFRISLPTMDVVDFRRHNVKNERYKSIFLCTTFQWDHSNSIPLHEDSNSSSKLEEKM